MATGKIYFNTGNKNIVSNTNQKIQAFIFNWPRTTKDAILMYDRFKKMNFIDKLFVINSDSSYQPEDWINLSGDAYFSEQFANAIKLFDGDIFFHIQADAVIPSILDVKKLFDTASYYFNELNFSVYTPDIDYTAWNNQRSKIDDTAIRFMGYPTQIIPILNSDCTCWFINKKTLHEFESLCLQNLLENSPLGWGCSAAMCAIGWKNKMPVIRDLEYKILHPNETGYEKSKASFQYKVFYSSIQDEFIRNYINETIRDRSKNSATSLIYRNLLVLP